MTDNNRVAIVTGGSRGIGKAIVTKLASENYNIAFTYVSDNSKAASEELAVELSKEFNIEAKAYQSNIASASDSAQLIESVVADFGGIDVLVNNAGITRDMLTMRMKSEDFVDVINTNLVGAFEIVKSALRPIMKGNSPRIINISSVVGVKGNVGQVNYAAAKAGLDAMTKTWAKEFASRNVTVNSIAPGYIQTDMTDVLDDKVKEEVVNHIPLKRLGQPEDIANAVAFVASEDTSYITGQVIIVDGGMTL